jgi:RNA polymerase sigma factor (sigma-70 family)
MRSPEADVRVRFGPPASSGAKPLGAGRRAGGPRPSGRGAPRPSRPRGSRPLPLRPGAQDRRAMVDNTEVGLPRSGARPSETGEAFPDALAGAQAHSPTACAQLYQSVAGRVCGYLRLRGATEPDDLTSEVFLRVFDHLDDFVGDEAGYRSWVFTIAHRLLLDERRRLSRRPQTVQLSNPVQESHSGGDTEIDAMKVMEDHDVAEVFAGLAPDQRDVLFLRVVGDLSLDQVAGLLGKRCGAVKALQHRGVARLRRRLEEISR